MSQRVQKPPKINTKYIQSGVRGCPRLLGGLDPILARIWHAPWPPFCRPNDPKGRQSDPKWSQMASKGRQISIKNRCENHHSSSYPFLYEDLAKRESKYVEHLSQFYSKTDVKQNWRRKVRYAIRPRKHI